MTFKITDDIQVNVYLPATGLFTWGVSKWDSTDKWGTTGDETLTAYNLINDVYTIETDIGYDLEAGIFSRPTVGTATVQLKGSKYDPNFDNRLRPNIAIDIQVLPDSAGTIYEPLFNGFIQSVSTEYTKDGQTLVTIVAVDRMQKILNKVFDSWTSGGNALTTAENITNAIAMAGYTSDFQIVYDNDYNIMGIQNETYAQASDVFSRIVTAEGGFLFSDRSGKIKFYKRNSLVGYLLYPVFTFTSSYTDTSNYPIQATYDDIKIENDTSNVVNKVNAELYSDTAVKAVAQDLDNIAIYGEQSAAIYPDLFQAKDLQNLVDDITLNSPGLTVSSIEFPMIFRAGNLHRDAVKINPHNTVNITFINDTINFTGNFLVNKVKHSITADNWYTTLETWKGI
jgi:hypothetical protein